MRNRHPSADFLASALHSRNDPDAARARRSTILADLPDHTMVAFVAQDTGAAHGPALPTASQLAYHHGIGFNRYDGPWITRSGFRYPTTDYVPSGRTIPNPADLPRAERA